MDSFINHLIEAAALAPAIKIGSTVHKAGEGDVLHSDVCDRHDLYDKIGGPDVTHGFTTHKGVFLDRAQAMKYAMRNKIITPKGKRISGPRGGLSSEILQHFKK